MEGLAELVPLLLVAAYYLLQGRRRAQRQRAERQTAPQRPLIDEEPRGPTPFQQFMEQMEAAMAEAAGESIGTKPTEPDEIPEPRPERRRGGTPAIPAPAPPVLPTRLPPAPPRHEPEFQSVLGSFDSARPSDHEAHGFGAVNPLSEQRFEEIESPSIGRRARRETYDPHGLEQPPPPKPTGARLGGFRRRLRDPQAARDAFVLQTIFGPRGGRRSDRR